MVGKKEKKAIGVKKLKNSLVGKRVAAAKKPAAEKMPAEKTHHRKNTSLLQKLNLFHKGQIILGSSF